MAIFDYSALTPAGKTEKGHIEADSAKTARVKLKKRGLAVTQITEKSAAGQPGAKKPGISFGSGVSVRSIAMMTRQLASLIKAKIPLVEALNAVVEQTDQLKLKVAVDQVRQDVNEGIGLAKALAKHPSVFDSTYINMVEAGESSGNLGLVLIRLAELKDTQLRIRGKVISGMTYPILILIVGIALVFVVFVFLIPKITGIFASMKKEIPLQTRLLMSASDIVISYWWAILGGMFFAVQIFRRWIATPKGREQWDRFRLSIPFVGNLVRILAVTRFTGAMSTLLGSGVPIIEAMNISKRVSGNVLIEKAIDAARENIKEGQSIAEPLKRSGEFPPLVIHMISVGERTGDLPGMLKTVAETFEEQATARITGMVNMIEPAMIVLMGGFVGYLFFAVFMPLMEISNVSK